MQVVRVGLPADLSTIVPLFWDEGGSPDPGGTKEDYCAGLSRRSHAYGGKMADVSDTSPAENQRCREFKQQWKINSSCKPKG